MPFLKKTSLLLAALLLAGGAAFSQKTVAHGKVLDDATGETLPYVTVQFEEGKVGTRTDIDGNFLLETPLAAKHLRVSYVGYETQAVDILPKQRNELVVRLREVSTDLKEVTVRAGKYRNRDNPAVDLVREVFRHKDENRQEGLDFYAFEQYEKLRFDLNNITEKTRSRRYLRQFQFVFDNVDTNAVNGKAALPIYLRERASRVFYRKNPVKSTKEVLLGEKQTNFDAYLNGDGVSQMLNFLYQDVDIYEPQIMLLGASFSGPLSGVATAMYHFYIVDTVEYCGQPCADVFFAPRNKADLGFMGNMLVALDSTFAVKKVEMGISKDINLNWVTDLHIEQAFDFQGVAPNRRLMLTRNEVFMEFKPLKKDSGRALLGKRSVTYRNFALNAPLPDSLFSAPSHLSRDTGAVARRDDDFWAAHRFDTLSQREANIYKTLDSVQRVPVFRRLANFGYLIFAGYKPIGGFDLGPIGTFYSFNDIEGTRLRLGGRTNAKFSKRLMLEGYGAYGFGDARWKFNAAATLAFRGHQPRLYPQNQLKISWQRDLRVPGVDLQFYSPDAFWLSFQRGTNDKMLLNDLRRIEYSNERRSGISYKLTAQSTTLTPLGALSFRQISPDGNSVAKADLTTDELGMALRFAPNEQLYDGPNYRIQMPNKHPVFTLNFRNGLKTKTLGGEYNYQKLTFGFQKIFFTAPLGYFYCFVDAGRTFGQVPWPLLEIHRANQSYSYQWTSFNLMNFLEFGSDKFVSVNVQQNFAGFFLNKIPLVRRLKLREMFSFKALYGGLDARNRPTAENGLLIFPTTATGAPLLQTLEKKPYVEVSVGVSNILRVIRLDYVRRATYANLPGAPRWGIRATTYFEF